MDVQQIISTDDKHTSIYLWDKQKSEGTLVDVGSEDHKIFDQESSDRLKNMMVDTREGTLLQLDRIADTYRFT